MPPETKLLDILLHTSLGAVLLVSAAYKLKDRQVYQMATFAVLGPLRKLYKPMSIVGLAIELAVGLSLCLGLYPTLAAYACLVLFLIFDAALISLRMSGYDGGCGCFGSNSAGGITTWHFIRNAVLSIAAAWLMFLRIK